MLFKSIPASCSKYEYLKDGTVLTTWLTFLKIIVSCQPFTAQREPTIFPEPDLFNPQRWIDAEKLGTQELMRDQITVFGKGARACVGRKLAMMEIKCATAAIVRRYNVKIGSSTTDDDMEMTDHTVLIPKGQKCILQLAKI
jgi:hypothetical protein